MSQLYKSKWLRCVGIALLTLLLISSWLGNIAALANNKIWVGRNYWNEPIDTWGQSLILLFLTVYGAYFLVNNRHWWL